MSWFGVGLAAAWGVWRCGRMALWAFVAAALLACLVAAAAPLFANGRVVEFDRRAAGPYEIALGKIPASPVVGSLHLTMTITDTAADAPVMGAEVVITAVGPPPEVGEGAEGAGGAAAVGAGIGPLIAEPDPNDPIYYDAATQVDRAGLWRFTVRVSAEGGPPSSAEFPIEVSSPNPITGIITLVTLVAFVGVIAMAVRVYIRERRRIRAARGAG